MFFLLLTLFAAKGLAQNLETIFLSDSSEHTWSPAYENALLSLSCDRGYYILVNVTSLDLDGEKGDYLLVKSGETADDEGRGKIFSFLLKKQRAFVLYSNAAFLKFYVNGTNENDKSGFVLSYRRFGDEADTTTETPQTTVPWPTPAPFQSANVTVYVAGKHFSEYYKIKPNLLRYPQAVNNFREAVGRMAVEYCKLQNIILSEQPTSENVLLQLISQCPLNWPDRNYCIEITFKLPVFLDTDFTNDTYQLTSGHLNQMWLRLGNDYLNDYGMRIYSVPNDGKISTYWIVLSTSFVFLFVLLLFIAKKLLITTKIKIRKRNDIDEAKERRKEMELGPDPLQIIPSLFEQHYPEYQPATPSIAANNFNDYFDANTEENLLDLNPDNFKTPIISFEKIEEYET